MPPPISSLSHLLSSDSITAILSETFAPPRIATNGRSGDFDRARQIFEFFFHQEAANGGQDSARHLRSRNGRGGPSRRRHSHIRRPVRRVAWPDRASFLVSSRVEAGIFEQEHAAFGQRMRLPSSASSPTQSSAKATRHAQQFRKHRRRPGAANTWDRGRPWDGQGATSAPYNAASGPECISGSGSRRGCGYRR